MRRIRLNVDGIIERHCEKCKKTKECCVFMKDGKSHIMCHECMFNQYGHNEPKRQKELYLAEELCKKCNKLEVELILSKYDCTGTYIKEIYECRNCKDRTTITRVNRDD